MENLKIIDSDVNMYDATFTIEKDGKQIEIYVEFSVEVEISHCPGDYWTPPCTTMDNWWVVIQKLECNCTEAWVEKWVISELEKDIDPWDYENDNS